MFAHHTSHNSNMAFTQSGSEGDITDLVQPQIWYILNYSSSVIAMFILELYAADYSCAVILNEWSVSSVDCVCTCGGCRDCVKRWNTVNCLTDFRLSPTHTNAWYSSLFVIIMPCPTV